MTEPLAGSPSVLARRTVRGIAWTLPMSLGSRAVGLVGTLLLARYLSPAEYGEVSAATIVLLTSSSVTTFGVGIYLVTHRELTRSDAFHATCWFLVTGAAAIVIVSVFGETFGGWFGAPALHRFVPLLAFSTLLDRVAYVPERMLVRDLRFRWTALSRAAAELTYTAVSLVMVAGGAGAMAIAWGNAARSGLRFFLIVPAVGWREWLEPHRLHLTKLLGIVSYGMSVSAAALASFGMRRWDNLLVGYFFGPAAMGAYNYAYNLADTPAVAVGEQMTDVIAASFPHLEGEQRAQALGRAITMLSVVMFPLAFGLGAVARTIVETFFDARWAAVGTMLLLLSVLSASRPVAHVLTGYLYASKRPGVVTWLECGSLAALVVAIAAVARAGTTWTCIAVGAVFVLRTLAGVWAVHRLDRIRPSMLLSPLARPLIASLAMVAVLLAVRPELRELPPAIQLLVEVALGAAVYVCGALLLFPETSRDFIGIVRSSLSRTRASSSLGDER